MALELHLIGTVHFDFEGPQRLRKFLTNLKPEKVAVEFSVERARQTDVIHTKLQDPLYRHSVLQGYERMFKRVDHRTAKKIMNIADYEYIVCRDYCDEHSIPLLFLGTISTEHWKAIFSDESHSTYQSYGRYLGMTPTRLSSQVARWYEEPLEPGSDFQSLVMVDEQTEPGLRKLEGRTVYVGGVAHTLGNYPNNLYARIKDLNPIRHKLIDADELNP